MSASPTLTDMQCLNILRQAIAAPVGVVLTTNNPTKARQAIYRFRGEYGNPEFDRVVLKVSPDAPETEVWFINKDLFGEKASVDTNNLDLL